MPVAIIPTLQFLIEKLQDRALQTSSRYRREDYVFPKERDKRGKLITDLIPSREHVSPSNSSSKDLIFSKPAEISGRDPIASLVFIFDAIV